MTTLDLTMTADVDGVPVPGFQPYTIQFPVREVFQFTNTTSSSSYADVLANVVTADAYVVRVCIVTTDTAVTLALFENGSPTYTFALNANQLFLVAGNTTEKTSGGNPFLRVSVPSGTATLTGLIGIL